MPFVYFIVVPSTTFDKLVSKSSGKLDKSMYCKSLPPILYFPVILTSPTTSNLFTGLSVPIPTLPLS